MNSELEVQQRLIEILGMIDPPSPFLRFKRWIGWYKRTCPACGKRDVPLPYRDGDTVTTQGLVEATTRCRSNYQRQTCPHCLEAISWKKLTRRWRIWER